jgi:hypothetical protein
MIEDRLKKEHAKKNIEQIKLIQKDLDELKNCEYIQKLNSLSKMKTTLLLSAAINFLQELIGVYEMYCKDELFFKVEQNND